jgi:protein tyrosine/serine phosphatase
MKRYASLLAVILIAAAFAQSHPKTQARDPRWAQLIRVEGVPNLHKISDALYRGAQPTAEGIRQLKMMGIKTIVNLRAGHSDRDLLDGTGLAYEEIPFRTWHAKDKDVVKFIMIVTDKKRQPVFFHCEHGSDRTGMMGAIYRIVVESWTKEEAIREMTHGGYGFHSIWINLVRHVRNVNVDVIKNALPASP